MIQVFPQLRYRPSCQGRVIGTLNVESSQAEAFTQSHADLLEGFADQAAVAIEKTRLYSELQELANELQEQKGDLQKRIQHS